MSRKKEKSRGGRRTARRTGTDRVLRRRQRTGGESSARRDEAGEQGDAEDAAKAAPPCSRS